MPLLAAALLAGCATVTAGLEQPVRVTPVCEGRVVPARCELANDKGRWALDAPGTVSVRKSLVDLAVTCTRAGTQGSANFSSKSNNNIAGNILLGGLVGAAFDSASGAGFNYPEELPVVLRPPCEAGAGATAPIVNQEEKAQ